MTSSARTEAERAAAAADARGETPFQRPEVILTVSDEGRLRWFRRVLGILVVLCLGLAVVVWWRLLS